MREYVQKRVGKEWTQIQEVHIWENRDEWRRIHHEMMTCPDGNITG
jgi:hypothetical protein